jgi:7-dehydrocholesterol reductase
MGSSKRSNVESGEKKTWGAGGLFANRELGSLALMILTPIVVFPFWYMCAYCHGDVFELGAKMSKMGLKTFLRDELFLASNAKAYLFDSAAWKMYLCYAAFELVLQRWMPGKTFRAEGAMTVSGHVPVYKANGFQSYLFTIVCLFWLRYDYSHTHIVNFNPATVYENMGKLLGISNILALALCVFLTFKGLNFPSTKEAGSNGSAIVDFFWGTELYPNILGWDVKQFTNCRFGMMFWQVGIFCYAMAQYDKLGAIDSAMLVSVVLQTVYIGKFFWWETGYFQVSFIAGRIVVFFFSLPSNTF